MNPKITHRLAPACCVYLAIQVNPGARAESQWRRWGLADSVADQPDRVDDRRAHFLVVKQLTR
jgi:hypothetical protein